MYPIKCDFGWPSKLQHHVKLNLLLGQNSYSSRVISWYGGVFESLPSDIQTFHTH